jgi:quinol monooxygenase YgiN
MLESIRQQLADPAQPFSLFVRLTLQPGAGPEFALAAQAVGAATQAEAGCLAYEFHRLAGKPETYLLCEKWRDFDALVSHFRTPHLAAFLTWMGAHAAAPTEVEVGQVIVPVASI